MNLELFKKDENKEISLTSLEIAELTGKEHFHVIRDIETYLEKVVEGGVSKFGDTYQNTQNKQSYKCYRLPKREVLILVSGYSVELRAKIIDRLEYLENELK
ncbi:Rha family transcriptional regulator, partial [Campylobacter jejuni]|nr:Rha family transcriptional regulator [Campylobacter jejuni]